MQQAFFPEINKVPKTERNSVDAELTGNYFKDTNCFVVAFGASDSGVYKLALMQHGQLLLSWDWVENSDTDFLPLKDMASRLDFPGNENVLESDLCVLQKLEQYLGLPFSLTSKTIDKKSRNVYVDEFII